MKNVGSKIVAESTERRKSYTVNTINCQNDIDLLLKAGVDQYGKDVLKYKIVPKQFEQYLGTEHEFKALSELSYASKEEIIQYFS